MHEQFDVSVVGSGGAGLVGALAATRAGKRALVLERSDLVGGATAGKASTNELGRCALRRRGTPLRHAHGARSLGVLLVCVLLVAACSDDDVGTARLPTTTVTSTPTPAASDSATPTPTAMRPPTVTSTVAPTPTRTPAPSLTPTSSPTSTPSPSATSTHTPVDPQAACDALRGRSIGGAEIGSAELVATSEQFQEHCKVLGTIPPQLNFEVRLPTTWSGRALFTGGAGLNGVILPPELMLFNPGIGFDGYVTIGTDSGHQGTFSDGSWALGNRLALENFAYLSIHTVLGAAREIVRERYGVPPNRVYFIGQSTGGREGLIAAQRWPDDFDGIVSLEPVYNMTALLLAGNLVARQVFATPGGHLPGPKVDALARATLDACDGLDGIADGIISHVAACRFDPIVLRCAGADDDECLTDEQIETVNTIHSVFELGVTLANGIQSYPGWPIGHESGGGGWSTWFMGTAPFDPMSSLGFTLSEQTIRYLIIGDPEIDPFTFSLAAYAEEIAAFSALVDATDPDLSAFAARGGKLILWHGLADYAVSAHGSADYYERVVTTLGDAAVNDFFRFYTSPGVDHFSSGPGAAVTDFLSALIAWVEEGKAPGDLVSFRRGPEPRFSRPLCRYPGYPHYNGKGEPSSAASFHCATP